MRSRKNRAIEEKAAIRSIDTEYCVVIMMDADQY